MKAYRIKHIPTGLYYQPAKRGGGNLSEKGKVYLTNVNGLSYNKVSDHIWIDLKKGSKVYRLYGDKLPELDECPYNGSIMQGRVPKDKFEIEYISESDEE